MITELQKRMDEFNDNFDGETLRKYQREITELKNTITKLENIMESSTVDQMKQKKRMSQLKRQGSGTHPIRAAKGKNGKDERWFKRLNEYKTKISLYTAHHEFTSDVRTHRD